ncbi:hypothetical protein ACHWQZ_G004028 [Mnemiopsis leidyi]
MKLAFAVLSNINDSELYGTLDVKVDLELSEISILELQETPPNFEALQELVEPEVLCSCLSPIDIALDLEEACLVAARISTEHADMYEHLAKQCQTFAKDFLACCQVPSDAELLLSMKNADNTFGRALMYNEKEFLTQPWIQVVCEKQWLGELDRLQTSCWCFIGAVVKVLLAPLLVPFWLMYGLVVGNLQQLNELIQLIGSPCLCFFSFVTSHIIFFVILMLICTDKTSQNLTCVEKLAYCWLLGKLFSDCIKYYKVIRLNSFKVSVLRVVFDCFYLLFFAVLFGIRIYTSTAETSLTLLLFAADILYAVATILHILQIVYVMQVTKFLGPILVSMRHFFWELLRFLAILMIMNISFSIAITKIFTAYDLYSNDNKTSTPTLSSSFSHYISISTTLFWASFSLVDLKDFEEYSAHIMALLLIACYIVLSSGLLIMILFAMINYQYTKAKKRFETEWKFLSVKLTHEFSLLHPSIIPFNLISLPISLTAQALVRMFGDSNKVTLFGGKNQVVEPHLVYYIQSKVILNPDCEEERQGLIQSLATSYLTRKSWPGIAISKSHKGPGAKEEEDAQSMTSSPTGLLDPALALERMSCNLEKQEHSIAELRRANQELTLKLDMLLKRLRVNSHSTDC